MKLAYPVEAPDNHAELMAMRGDFKMNLRLLRSIGYRSVELLVRDAEALMQTDFSRTLQSEKMSVCAVSTAPIHKQDGYTLLSPDSERSANAILRIRGFIPLAGRYGCPILIGKVRGNTGKSRGMRLDDLRKILIRLCAEAAEHGVSLLLEPQNGKNINNLNTIGQAIKFIAAVGAENLGLHLDLCHMNDTEPSIAESISDAAGKIGFVHAADKDRTLPGDGRIDFEAAINALKAVQYDGFISPEVKQLPDSESVARSYFDRMRNMIGPEAG